MLAFGSATSQTLEVMTYNLRYDNPSDAPNHWENRRAYLCSQLRFHAPDVFGVQEGLKHQLDQIDGSLSDYAYVGVGRDDGRTKGEYSAIFYQKEKLELREQGTFWLSRTPDKPSRDWDAALPRICTYARFRLKDSGKEFFIFNTHFDHKGKEARRKSAELILDKMDRLNSRGLPVVLMGDFNLQPESQAIQSIASRMTDTHLAAGDRAHGPGGTFNGFNTGSAATARIDYIFVSPADWVVIRSGILSDAFEGRFPSDHFPVLATLGIKE